MKTPKERTGMFEKISGYVYQDVFLTTKLSYSMIERPF